MYLNANKPGADVSKPSTQKFDTKTKIVKKPTKIPTVPDKIWNYSADASLSESNLGAAPLPSPAALSSEFSSVLNRIQGILANAQNDKRPNISQVLGEVTNKNKASTSNLKLSNKFNVDDKPNNNQNRFNPST